MVMSNRTIRRMPEIEFFNGLRLFPNLDEYYATPQNITEKF
jgi:hypothetical protein